MNKHLIRRIENKDVDLVLNELEKYSPEATHIPFDRASTFNSLYAAMKNDNAIALLCEEDGKILGVGWMYVICPLSNVNHNQAVETCWHSSLSMANPIRYRVLIEIFEALEKWGIDRGAKDILFGVNTDNTLGKFLESKGYKVKEIVMIKEV